MFSARRRTRYKSLENGVNDADIGESASDMQGSCVNGEEALQKKEKEEARLYVLVNQALSFGGSLGMTAHL